MKILETHKLLAQLILKHQTDSLNEQERETLQEWINHSDRNRKLFNRLSDKKYWEKVRNIDLEKEWQRVISTAPVKPAPVRMLRIVYKVMKAAACIAPFVIGGYFLFYKEPGNMAQVAFSQVATHPGLQFEDGSVRELNEAADGPLSRINGLEVSNRNNHVKFEQVTDTNLREVGPLYNNINTIATPKGCTYFITLPDGSEVTLNECSILQFPSQFDPNERVVVLIGNEAYFKVKPCLNKITGKKIPFTVIYRRVNIKVQGTEFDVKGFDGGDSIKTSLVRGSVTLKTDLREYLLDSGKALLLNSDGGFSKQTAIDLNEVNGWRVKATFDKATIEEVMEHISRIFDVTVTYKNKTAKRFSTYIPATGSLAEALNYVEQAKGVKFWEEGNHVYVEFINQ